MEGPTQLSATDTKTEGVSAQQYVMKEKRSRALPVVSVMFLLMTLVAGAMTYLWYGQQQAASAYQTDIASLKSERSQLQTNIDTLKKQDANLAENTVVDQATKDSASKSDQQLIADSIEAYVHAQTAYASSTVEVNTINYKAGATVVLVPYTTKNPIGGLGCIVKKSDSVWVVVSCGQGMPDQQVLTAFGIPSNFSGSL